MNLVKSRRPILERARGVISMGVLIAGAIGGVADAANLVLFAGKDLARLELKGATVSGDEVIVDSGAEHDVVKGAGPAAGKSYRQAQVTTPAVNAGKAFDQLIVSWNAVCPEGSWLVIEARARQDDKWTPWFNLGYWTVDGGITRTSIAKQKNSFGDVDTDTLVLNKPAYAAEARVTMCFTGHQTPVLKLLACDFSVSSTKEMDSLAGTPGSPLEVPEISQLSYPPKGNVWCSPTSVTMVMNYWAGKLKRPDLATDVRTAAAAIYDEAWGGTGNWTFNTAFAGSYKGLRAYCARLESFREVQRWTDKGVPVILSISSSILHNGDNASGGGHLIVCDGFDAKGDPVVNDPYAKLDEGQKVRRTYRRDRLFKAWRQSFGTVYLIYPESMDSERPASAHDPAPTPLS